MSHQEENSGSRLREQAKVLADLLSGVGEEQAELLEHLSRAYDARARGLERERTYLEQQLGPERPEVAETERGIADARLLARRFAREAEAARTPAPRVTATTWALSGRILGPDWEPRPDVAVTLRDDKGTRDDRFGETHTDQRGLFELRGAVGEPTVETGAAPEEESAPPVFVQAAMADGTIYRDPQPLFPVGGRADSIQVVLREGGCFAVSLESPPPVSGQRRFALPTESDASDSARVRSFRY